MIAPLNIPVTPHAAKPPITPRNNTRNGIFPPLRAIRIGFNSPSISNKPPHR